MGVSLGHLLSLAPLSDLNFQQKGNVVFVFCQQQGQSTVPTPPTPCPKHLSVKSCQRPRGGRHESGNTSVSNLSSQGTHPATDIKKDSTSFIEPLLFCKLLQGNPIHPTAGQIPVSRKISEMMIRSASKDS